MTIINLLPIERTYKNNGQHAEQCARFTLTGEIQKADNLPAYKGADCKDIQIKSARATICKGLDLEEHLLNDKAKLYGYVIKDFSIMYLMNKIEYKEFCETFQTITTESKTKEKKLRLKSESSLMIQWFRARL